MAIEIVSVIGGLAAAASTSSFAPQAWKIIKTRETKGISVGMYGITVVGFALWFAYGVMLGQWPLIFTNSVCQLLSGFVLIMKVLSPQARDRVADKLDPSAEKS